MEREDRANSSEVENKRHHLFDVALKRNGEARAFSTFRTEQGLRITVWPNRIHGGSGESFTRIVVRDINTLSDGKTLEREESFSLYEDGSVESEASADIPGIIGGINVMRQTSAPARIRAKEIFNERHSHIAGKNYPHPMKETLDLIASWLSDPNTVRVDPYNFDRQLPDEDTDYDREITGLVHVVEDFSNSLWGDK